MLFETTDRDDFRFTVEDVYKGELRFSAAEDTEDFISVDIPADQVRALIGALTAWIEA